MQSQMSSQKRAIKKKKILNYKTHLFSTFFILTPPTSSVHNFLFFFVQIERFKLLWNCHLTLYKSSYNSKSNKVIFKEFLRGSEIGYELLGLILFITTPLTSGGCNFLAFSSFLPIFSDRCAKRRASNMGTINNGPSCKNGEQTLP